MAGSRLERIGTIYSRTTGLIRSGALKWEDRPLWYDIYETFPPKEEPRFDRPIPNMKLQQIFYNEDKIRAIFHRNNKYLGAVNMSNNDYKSLTQKFIEKYQQLENQYDGKVSEEQLYHETIDIIKKGRDVKKETPDEEDAVSLSSTFKEALSKQKEKELAQIKIDVKNIFNY